MEINLARSMSMARLEELAYGASAKGIIPPDHDCGVNADGPTAGEIVKAALIIKQLIACRHLVVKTAGQRLGKGVLL
jgi:hypothetical protein